MVVAVVGRLAAAPVLGAEVDGESGHHVFASSTLKHRTEH